MSIYSQGKWGKSGDKTIKELDEKLKDEVQLNFNTGGPICL